MASLVKNSGTYGLIWTDNSRPKPQTRESLKTTDKAEARRLKARLEHEYWHGGHDPWKRKWYEREPETGQVSVGTAVEEFIRYKSGARGQAGWAESTALKETFTMRNYADIIGKGKPLSEVTKEDLQRVYYRKGVHSDHTRQSDYISLTTFFNWAIEQGYLKRKPDFKPSKPQAKIPKFIYPAQLSALIAWKLGQIEANIKDNRLYAEPDGAYWVPLGWMMLAGTGLRPVELAHLKVPHVHEGYLVVGEDFTTKVRAERTVPLLFEARQAAGLLVDPNFRALEPNMSGSEYLLGRKPSYSKRKLSREFSNAWDQVFPGEPKRTLYNLKDTFAVRFLYDGSGRALNDLADILGHASLDTTRKYLKAIPYGTRLEGTIWDAPVSAE